MDESNSLADLNENLDRLSSSGFYSFTSVLDSIVDTIEKYRTCEKTAICSELFFKKERKLHSCFLIADVSISL